MLSNIAHQLLNMVNLFSPQMRFLFAVFIGVLAYVSLFFINKSFGFNIKNYNMNIAILATIDIVYLCFTYYKSKKSNDDGLELPGSPKETKVDDEKSEQSGALSTNAILEELSKERLSPIKEGTNEDTDSPMQQGGNEFPNPQNTQSESGEAQFVEKNEKGELIES